MSNLISFAISFIFLFDFNLIFKSVHIDIYIFDTLLYHILCQVQMDFIFQKTGTKLHRLFHTNNRNKVQLIDFVPFNADFDFSDRVAENSVLRIFYGANCKQTTQRINSDLTICKKSSP
jgi:hypothetical protein